MGEGAGVPCGRTLPGRHIRALPGLHLGSLLLAGTALFPKLITLPADQIIALRSLVAVGVLGLFTRFSAVSLRVAGGRDRRMVALVVVIAAWQSVRAARA